MRAETPGYDLLAKSFLKKFKLLKTPPTPICILVILLEELFTVSFCGFFDAAYLFCADKLFISKNKTAKKINFCIHKGSYYSTYKTNPFKYSPSAKLGDMG